MTKLKKLKSWYEEHEKHISTSSLIFGFVFDALTLKRIDSLLDNLWLGVNLFAVALCILLINRAENSGKFSEWKHFWYFNTLQFSFGALLGASFIFYFRSATLAVSWPFLLILLGAMVGNEVLKKHYDRLTFQLSFLFLSIFVFAIFLIPVLMHKVGAPIFLLSGGVSLLLIYLFVSALKKFAKEKFRKGSSERIWVSIFSIFFIINALYFTNLIPPIPLSLKDAGVYHSIAVGSRGEYLVSEEERVGWKRYLELRQKVHLLPNEPLYAYAAIFAPGSLNTRVVHEWQYRNEFGEWVTATRISITLSGGRDQGFRTYSNKTSLTPGIWRVNIENPRGQLIGRVNFEIIAVDTQVPLVTTVKD